MNTPPKISIITIKAKLQIAKANMTSALTSFFAINHYQNTEQLRLENLEERTYEAIDQTSEEEQTEQIDQLSQFRLQVDYLSQKSMHISETQVNITPVSTSRTMRANQQLDVDNTQTGRAANVSFDATNDDEEEYRRQQTQLDNNSSTPETIDNH